MLIPAHFEMIFCMKLLKFDVKIKGKTIEKFNDFVFEIFFEKKVCIFGPEAACCEQNFFPFVLSARARARAHGPPHVNMGGP